MHNYYAYIYVLQVEHYEELEVLGQSINQLNDGEKTIEEEKSIKSPVLDNRRKDRDQPTKDLLDLTSSSDEEEFLLIKTKQ